MSVTITYACNGCFATETVSGIVQRHEVIVPSAITVGGVDYDRCLVRTPTIKNSAPEGWVAFDPYTGVCYCPKCWAEIEA